jgi:hypothetical protein
LLVLPRPVPPLTPPWSPLLPPPLLLPPLLLLPLPLQMYIPHRLLSQLAVIQLLAPSGDALMGLQEGSAAHVAAALAAGTAAHDLQLTPLLHLAAARSSASPGSSRQQPSLWQLGWQAGCYAGPSHLLLPWLQLLTTFRSMNFKINAGSQVVADGAAHQAYEDANAVLLDQGRTLIALTTDSSSSSSDSGSSNSDCCLAAMAVALHSCVGSSTDSSQLGVVVQWLKDFVDNKQDCLLPTQPLLWPVAADGPSEPLLGPQASFRQHNDDEQQQQQQQQHEEGAVGTAAAAAASSQPAAAAAAAGVATDSMTDLLLSCSHFLHADSLLSTSPAAWQQHLAAAAAASRTDSSKELQQHLSLLADLSCDWCQSPVQLSSSSSSCGSDQRKSTSDAAVHPGAAAAAAAGRQQAPYGCAACSAAQYCSAECAAAAKKVHGPNCW